MWLYKLLSIGALIALSYTSKAQIKYPAVDTANSLVVMTVDQFKWAEGENISRSKAISLYMENDSLHRAANFQLQKQATEFYKIALANKQMYEAEILYRAQADSTIQASLLLIDEKDSTISQYQKKNKKLKFWEWPGKIGGTATLAGIVYLIVTLLK